ncbi:hypothetical protein PSZ20_23310, partial [Shigella flexneri]|nr:hypothetical protein [Shigella flexneri]
ESVHQKYDGRILWYMQTHHIAHIQQVQHLSDLLNMSDVVSLHVPENPSTKNMMGGFSGTCRLTTSLIFSR